MPLFNLNKDDSKQNADANKDKPQKEENLYVNIFEKEKKKEKEESDIISGVFEKKEKEEKKITEKILGPLPELEKRIIGAFDPTKRNLKLLRTLFISVFVISLLTIGFFYSELSPNFDLLNSVKGPNVAQQLQNIEAEVISLQTTINQSNLLLLHYYLDELSYLSDTYAQARADSVPLQERIDLQDKIILAYENAQTKFKEPKSTSNIDPFLFESGLRSAFQADIIKLKSEEETDAIALQVEDYESAFKLSVNSKLNSFLNKNSDDLKNDLPRDDSKLFAMTQESFEVLDNAFTAINKIKKSRMKWSVIVNEIETVTKTVDTLFNTGFFEDLGGIQYVSYNFDSSTNRITLNGKAKRDDGSTFTLITNLIDALENSEIFEDVDNRSYPKSGSQEAGYTSSFRIDLTLIQDKTN